MKLTLLALLLTATAAQADLYKCKDAQGKITYQDVHCDNAVKKFKRDTSVGDPIIIQRNRAEVTEFQGRRAIRIAAEEAREVEIKQEKESMIERREKELDRRALRAQSAATQEIAEALTAPREVIRPIRVPSYVSPHLRHRYGRGK